MAQRKPLVIGSNNEIEELASGDTLDASVSEVDVISRTNDNSGSITIGQAVYASGAGEVDLAQANASSTAWVLGLVRSTSIATEASGLIQTDGVLAATTEQWDAVTGGSGGLTAGTEYILNPDTAGRISPRSTTIDAGEYVVPVGRALSTTELEITLGPRFKRN
jgi:hypothetical protein